MNRNNAGLKVLSVEKGSLGEKNKIKPGWRLMSVDHKPIGDILDYQFHTAEEQWTGVFEDQKTKEQFEFNFKGGSGPAGLKLEQPRLMWCKNKCVFCFIDQNPKGMRKDIYIKDEDFRYSFLFGSYVTLTDYSPEDLKRIVEQRLSPMYISIHTTNPILRERMIKHKRANLIMEQLDYLAKGRIEMHGQVVLCPGFNDAEELERTVRDLIPFYPYLKTVAIVPLGLTRHRKNLPSLQPVTREIARATIKAVSIWQEKFKTLIGSRFIFLSDEWFVTAGLPFPEHDHYEDFLQWQNGVGTSRAFLDQFTKIEKSLPQRLAAQNISLITAPAAQSVLWQVVERLNKIQGLNVELNVVKNNFYGHSINITGLLTGQDILKSLKQSKKMDKIFMPNILLKEKKSRFLDDLSLRQLKEEIHTTVHPVSATAQGIKEIIKLCSRT